MWLQNSRPGLGAATCLRGLDSRLADIKGGRVRYFVGGGRGVPVVLVHGLGGAACNWTALVRTLAGRHPLLVPELPGHGGSDPLAATASLEPFADRVLGVLEREGWQAPLVVGHSLGGLVALRMARRRPEGLLGVMLAGAAGISSTSRRARMALAVTGRVKPGRRAAPFRHSLSTRPRLRRAALGWGVADVAALSPHAAERFLIGPGLHADTLPASLALVADDVREHLGEIRVPTLVLWGARDTQVAVGDAFDFARRLGAPVRVIADCGHLLIAERADACAHAIETFADRLDRIGQFDELPLEPEPLGQLR
jgi:pimeloyl-ACP methyl ester carboxylesterase